MAGAMRRAPRSSPSATATRVGLKIVGDQFGIDRRYADAAEMLAEEKLDFVDIATTVGSHRALVELAAAHRLPAICQKPFAPTLEDAKAMVAACEKAGVPLMVHENFRWQSPIQAVKAVLDSGEIGEPFFGRVSFRSGYDVFSGQPYLAEGKRFIVEDLGIHILDVARFLLGDVKALTARTAPRQPEDQGRRRRDHAARPRQWRNLDRRLQLRDQTRRRAVSGDADRDRWQRRNASAGQGYRLTVAGTKRHSRARCLSAAAALGVTALAQYSGKRCSDPAALGRLPARRCGDLHVGRDNLKTFALVEAAYSSAESGETARLSRSSGMNGVATLVRPSDSRQRHRARANARDV